MEVLLICNPSGHQTCFKYVSDRCCVNSECPMVAEPSLPHQHGLPCGGIGLVCLQTSRCRPRVMNSPSDISTSLGSMIENSDVMNCHDRDKAIMSYQDNARGGG